LVNGQGKTTKFSEISLSEKGGSYRRKKSVRRETVSDDAKEREGKE
jgi:hypothetical protein